MRWIGSWRLQIVALPILTGQIQLFHEVQRAQFSEIQTGNKNAISSERRQVYK